MARYYVDPTGREFEAVRTWRNYGGLKPKQLVGVTLSAVVITSAVTFGIAYIADKFGVK